MIRVSNLVPYTFINITGIIIVLFLPSCRLNPDPPLDGGSGTAGAGGLAGAGGTSNGGGAGGGTTTAPTGDAGKGGTPSPTAGAGGIIATAGSTVSAGTGGTSGAPGSGGTAGAGGGVGSCAPAATETGTCGTCGAKSRTCPQTKEWGTWSACNDPCSAPTCVSLSLTQAPTWESPIGQKVKTYCGSNACHPQESSSYNGFVQWYKQTQSTFTSYVTPSHNNPTVNKSEFDLIKCWLAIGLPQTKTDLN